MLNARLVKFARGTETIAGFLAFPSHRGPHRAIIAIHEWWGLTAWVMEQAMNLAANAYVVLALDLYQGNVATTPSQARKLK
jgi:carboxymethylenebutenolidase